MAELPEKKGAGDVSTDSKIEYPDSHPNAKRIKSKKDEMNDKFRNFEARMSSARIAYTSAMEQLRMMGNLQSEATSILKELAEDMKELQKIVVEPLL